MSLNELKKTLDSFSPIKIKFATKIIKSLANPLVTTFYSADTWLTDKPDWLEYFALALSVHHGTTKEPLGLSSFEAVFRNACEHLDWDIHVPKQKNQRFVDLIVHSKDQKTRKLSLKSTAAKNLSKTTIHISKLTEAAWIQDTRTPKDRREHTLKLFAQYQNTVSHIIMLRSFRKKDSEIPDKYQLIEIPVNIFNSIQNAPIKAFERDAPIIECYVKDKMVAVVAIDRSDAKITVRRIQINACTIHAEWSRE